MSYARHPAVLGPGFEPDDIQVSKVNDLPFRTSGVSVLTINNDNLGEAIQKSRLLRTYR